MTKKLSIEGRLFGLEMGFFALCRCANLAPQVANELRRLLEQVAPKEPGLLRTDEAEAIADIMRNLDRAAPPADA